MTSDDMDNVHGALLMAWAERDDALARVAALESQIAAQGWRPVTEPPTEDETQCLLRSFTERYGYEYIIATWCSFRENPWKGTTDREPDGYWFDGEGDEADIDDWQEWQLLPGRPQEAQ